MATIANICFSWRWAKCVMGCHMMMLFYPSHVECFGPASFTMLEGGSLEIYSSSCHLRATYLQPKINMYSTLAMSGEEDSMG